MEKMQSKNIDFTFRILYVLAIVMIVDGHIGSFDYLSFNGLFPYQNYHLALFIFASGYFINLKRSYKKFISHKFMKLILPLYIWNFIYGVLVFCLNRYNHFNLGGNFSFYNLLYAPIVDGHQFIYNMGSWFLVPLFVVQLIVFCILKPFVNKHAHISRITLYSFFLLSCLLAIITLQIAPNNFGERNMTLMWLRIFYFLPFYSLGVFYRFSLEKYDTLNSVIYFSIIITLTLILKINFPNCNIIPAWLDEVNSPTIVIFTLAFLAIFFWLRIAKIVSPIFKKNSVLEYLSTHTFDIMMHHFVGFMIVKAALSPLGIFDMNAFKTNIWYYHFPFAENLITPVYIFITIVIALFIGFTSRKIYYILLNKIKRLINVFREEA